MAIVSIRQLVSGSIIAVGLAASTFVGTAPDLAHASVASTYAAPGPINYYQCRSGYVWREARPTDLVCVTPARRDDVARQNSRAASRVQPGGGLYGPNTCRSGFVWREAFVGDVVCVTPSARAQTHLENSQPLKCSRYVYQDGGDRCDY